MTSVTFHWQCNLSIVFLLGVATVDVKDFQTCVPRWNDKGLLMVEWCQKKDGRFGVVDDRAYGKVDRPKDSISEVIMDVSGICV